MKIKQWAVQALRAEPVLCAAAVLAVLSMFFVPPGPSYLGYLDMRTLCLLFCLMTVVAGWQGAGVFQRAAGLLLQKTGNARQLSRVLIFLCFFSSMFITNDVALITFVPLALLVLRQAGQPRLEAPTVVLQTVAANLGSVLLPMGNPQNLYLYGRSGMGLGAFVLHMLPLWLLSLALLWLATLALPQTPLTAQTVPAEKGRHTVLYTALFALCLCAVAGWLSYWVALGAVALCALLWDRPVLRRVDYLLLLTFVCFFVFIGNIKAIPALSELLGSLIRGNELLAGVVSSQVISNVPAAVLLAGFTEDIPALLWAVNIGGLGTLIASLASLISYKAYARKAGGGSYMKLFTLVNLAMLAVLCIAAWVRFTFW